jgi:hypothetical protein
MNEDQNTIYQNLWDATKIVLIGKFIVVNVCIKKKKHLKPITQSSTLSCWKKEKGRTPAASRRKEII